MTSADVLTIYVIYDHPLDMPDYFVVRAQYAQRDGSVRADTKAYGFIELDKARAWCEQQGLVCLARHPDDEPHIVETWL